MPLYEYQCEACAHRFEVIQKYSDAAVDICPRCNGVVRKLLSSPAIQFKGSGWYITDYARAGKSDPGEKGSSSGQSDSKSDSTGSESKSDAKSESKSESKPESKSKSESKTESKSDSKSESKPSTS
jgi:putative FmdB family regulatory protein